VQTRKLIKKKVEYMIGDIKRALAQAASLREIYGDAYPTHKDTLETLMQGLTVAWELAEKFREIV
jgi:hypothetical protein